MLRAANLTKRFGGLTAVDDVGFSLERGEILGLIGPNGAGKSTLVNLVTGFDWPDRGTVQLDENALRDTSPARRARLGLSRTFQRPRLVANVSVEDLLTGAAWIAGAPRWFVRSRRAAQEVERVLDELGLQPIRRALVQELASPSLRLVQIAMTVLTGCRYMMLDEPVAGCADPSADARHSIVEIGVPSCFGGWDWDHRRVREPIHIDRPRKELGAFADHAVFMPKLALAARARFFLQIRNNIVAGSKTIVTF